MWHYGEPSDSMPLDLVTKGFAKGEIDENWTAKSNAGIPQ